MLYVVTYGYPGLSDEETLLMERGIIRLFSTPDAAYEAITEDILWGEDTEVYSTYTGTAGEAFEIIPNRMNPNYIRYKAIPAAIVD